MQSHRMNRRIWICLIITLLILALPCSTLTADQSPSQVASPGATITAGSEIGYPPYCIVNEKGEADGFSVQLLRAALAAMGYQVDFHVDQWSVVKHALEIGTVEVLPLVGRTPEREEIYDFTFPYLTMHGTILINRTTTGINTIHDLPGKRVAVMEGDNAEEYVRRTLLGHVDIVTTNTFAEALLLLSAQQVDAVIIQQILALQLIKELGLTDLRITGPPLTDFTQSFCFAVQDGNTPLLSILNEGLSIVISDGTYDRLYAAWFGPLQDFGKTYDRIVVGGDHDYPPYEYHNENGEPEGFNVDLTKAIAEELGLEVEIVLDRWSTTYNHLLSGEIDMIQGVFYSLERDKILNFSQPHSVVSHVIVTREGEFPGISTMEDLADLTILVMDQDIMHHKAMEFGYDDHVIPVSSQEEALRLLSSGIGDLALTAKMPSKYWIDKHGWKNLVVRSQIIASEYAFAALDSNPDTILQEFSEGLSAIKANGRYQEIYNTWFGVYEQAAPSPWVILQQFAFIFIPILLIALLALLWSTMLRRRVRLRTQELQLTTEHLQAEIAQKEIAERAITTSEAKFREYVEHSPVGIIECDGRGRIKEVNSAMLQISGFSREELLEMNFLTDLLISRSFSEDDQPEIPNILAAVETSSADPLMYRDKLGNIGHLAVNSVPLASDRFLVFTTEVTDLVTIQNELAADKERLQVTLRSIGDGVITTDTEGRIVIINHVAEQLTGWTQLEAEGRSLEEVFKISHEHTGIPCKNPIEQIMKTGAITEMAAHTLLTSRTGATYIIADSGAPIMDQDHTIIGVVLVFRDMTEELRIQERLQQTTRLDSLGILAGGIAHDFNNLLSGLFGFVQLARESAQRQEDCTPYLDEVIKIFDRTKGLTQQLLTFARGGQPIRAARDLRPLIIDSTSFALSGSRITSTYHLPEDLWACNVDDHQFSQVIDNIVINAKQAMHDDSGTITILAENIRLEDDEVPPLASGEYVKISITDTGSGIPPQIIDKIFDPFFTTKQQGNGLGLATCYSIIKKHDGIMSVTSHLGSGTTFVIYLPRSVTPPPVERPDTEKSSKKRQGSGKVLILDDEEMVRTVVGKMVSALGYTPVMAADGSEITELCSRIQGQVAAGEIAEPGFVAALFDLTVPGGMGGKEAVKQIRGLCESIPIFASSGYSEDPIMADPQAYGFTDSIAKPFKMDDLARLLATYVKNG